MILAFPTIRTDKPDGSDLVSTIDNAERETREWLRQCMLQISGYPDVDTVSVKTWDNNSKPTNSSVNGNYLLGYNTDTGQLELIGANGNTIQVVSDSTMKSIALLAHPVGTYYWTSDTEFNPQTAWGGTWVRVQDGCCLISNNTEWGNDFKVGATGGDRTVVLEKKNLPVLSLRHGHEVGGYTVEGSITSKDEDGNYPEYFTYADRFNTSGALSVDDKVVNGAGISHTGHSDAGAYKTLKLKADKTHGFKGTSAEALKDVGSGVAHQNMPPYKVGVLWHRVQDSD